MKRILCQLLLLVLSLHLHAIENPQFFYHTVQVGKTITISSNTYPFLSSFESRCGNYSQYDPSIVSVSYSNSTFTIKGLRKGSTTIIMLPPTAYASTVPYFHVINVVDVCEITILPSITVLVGENYTYEPTITDIEAKSTFAWTSNNTGVATVSSSGEITAISPGKATITCTATNGVKTQSLVTVSPLLLSGITISNQSCEMNVDDEIQLSAICSPENATNKTVKWLTSNENIAQVDDDGNVTAIGTGYCTIYAKADDGSGKFDKCLIHVDGPVAVRGDMNADGKVTVTDAVSVIDIILNNQ